MDVKVKVGVLYICTGPYEAFWKVFYDSMNSNLMPETKRTYYVFTDAEKIYKEEDDDVIRIKIENKPWPLVTLLRFHTFLGIEEQLKENDYLLFSNANLACNRRIDSKEILPEGKDRLFFTIHPGYFNRKPREYVYERRRESTAYIPYNCGSHYVIGAFFGGKTDAFLEMCHKLVKNTDEDLKKNIIARWHDESQINRYIIGRNDVKLLPPSYCYPCGFEIDYENVIYAMDKKSVFDIEKFKGYKDESINKKTFEHQIKRIKSRFGRIETILGYWGDSLLRKRINKL